MPYDGGHRFVVPFDILKMTLSPLMMITTSSFRHPTIRAPLSVTGHLTDKGARRLGSPFVDACFGLFERSAVGAVREHGVRVCRQRGDPILALSAVVLR